ncbi:MAG: hypothetical protein ACI808_002362 [Paraglaciecola sp.]
MKKLTLNHLYTPSQLLKINQKLSELFSITDFEESEFLRLVTLREETILSHLSSLDKNDIKQFSEAELKVNSALHEFASKLSKASLNQLTGLLRGRKAVKKYT